MTPTPPRPDAPAAARDAATADSAPRLTPKIREAHDAREALAAALSRAGIQLPAMAVRTPWPDDRGGRTPYALLHLGVCSAPVALMLADVVRTGVARMAEECGGTATVGAAVRDTALDRVGRVTGYSGPYLKVQPLGGGASWEADPGRVRRLDQDELLSALVAEANAWSRRNTR
ncbi:hypothetical protein [Streptomyces sp. TRM 70351]|uniref:hypothetical protein n=1 Tax=Streptomyces sp. TRM 70351 TaxID=3116552 RepID=UPI003FCE528A